MVCQKYLQILCVILVTGLVCGDIDIEETTEEEPIVLPTISTNGIILTCSATQMIVEIPTSLLTGGMEGDDVYFDNESNVDDQDCWGVIKFNDDGEEVIELVTDLTACGTVMQESTDTETYTNKVSNRDEDGISRQYVIDIPLTCTYNRNERVESVRYQLTDYTIDKTLDEDGAYTFSFDIYTSDSYETVVPSYPVNIGLNEELHFAASVVSPGASLDLSIRSCRATPNTEYDDSTNFDFILNGCPVDDNAEIQNLEDDSRVEVMLKTLRFVGEVSDLVYIHCNLLVCDATTDDCDINCDPSSSEIMERKRRDVSSKLKTKRFTRGPLRVVRSAQRQDSVLRMDASENGAATQQEVTNAFNPWIVAMAAMATVVMALAAIVAVVLRKVNRMSAAPAGYKEGSARILDDQEEI